MRFAVLVFPGTWSDRDCRYVLRDRLGHPTDLVWHRETDLHGYDAVIFPGGFSYGDYLRLRSAGPLFAHNASRTPTRVGGASGVWLLQRLPDPL